MNIRKISTIGRPLDYNYESNRIISYVSLIALLGGFAYTLISGNALVDSLLWGFGYAVAVFLTWALGREIDPDYEASAFLSTGLIAPLLIWFSLPDFLIMIWTLLLLRMLNRSTGLEANLLDSFIITGLAVWLDWVSSDIYIILTFLAFFFDAVLGPRSESKYYLAALNLVFYIIIGFLKPLDTVLFSISTASLIWILAGCLLFLPVIFFSAKPTFKADVTGEFLQSARLKTAQVFFLVIALQALTFGEISNIEAILPLLAVIAGTSLHRYYLWIMK
jgi:hypothetical protein